MPTPRKFLVVAKLDKSTSTALEEIAQRRGMTLISTASRLVRWVARQNDDVQNDILIGEGNSQNILKHIAAQVQNSHD